MVRPVPTVKKYPPIKGQKGYWLQNVTAHISHINLKIEISEKLSGENLKTGKKKKTKKKAGEIMTRLEELENILNKMDEDKATAIKPLLSNIVYMEQRLTVLRKLPHLRVHPANPERQEITAAGKQYKEMMQAYTNAQKLLLSALSRYSVEEQDEFDAWMQKNRMEGKQ